jgi:hypothetical protein
MLEQMELRKVLPVNRMGIKILTDNTRKDETAKLTPKGRGNEHGAQPPSAVSSVLRD